MILNTYNVGLLLPIDGGVAGAVLKKSIIRHKDAKQRTSAGCLIESGEMVGIYYASLLYSVLSGQWQLKKTYGESVMPVTVEHFPKSTFKSSDSTVIEKGVGKTLWIFPEPFYFMRYMKNDGCLPGDKATDMLKESYPRQNIVSFVYMSTPQPSPSRCYSLS